MSTLSVYRKLLRLARSLPEEKKAQALSTIRHEFRTHKDVTEQKEITELLQRAQSKIGYLKIVTPKEPKDRGIIRFFYKNGERIDGASVSDEPAKCKPIDMESVYKRHNQLIRRQYFMDRKVPPKNVF